MGFFDFNKRWNITNEDTLETIQGQFEAEELTEEVGAAYTERFTLNRQNGILQWLHGSTDTITAKLRFFDDNIIGGTIPRYKRQLPAHNKLKAWAGMDPALGRPPICLFWIGNGHVQKRVVIENVSALYDQPASAGRFRGSTCNVALRKYTPYSLETRGNFDTRYHVTSQGEYYELICVREYKDPMIGVLIRQDNPTKAIVYPGDIVKLPSVNGQIRTRRVTQQSTIFKTSYDRSPTPQRDLRLQFLEKRGNSQVSHVLLNPVGGANG